MLKIELITKPDRKISQSITFFQFGYMDWTPADMETQEDRWGSLPFAYVIAKDQTKIVGAVNLLKRNINYLGTKIKLGGIGGVSVHTSYRRKGLATKLIKKGLNHLKTSNCEVVFLCTDIEKLGKLYTNCGFVPLNKPYIATGGNSGKKYEDQNGMVASLKSAKKLNLILNGNKPFDLQGQDW